MTPSRLADDPRELLRTYATTLAALRRTEIIRSANAPAGDYAELLVAAALDGALADRSSRSWDVLAPDLGTIEVKARVVSDDSTRSQRTSSPLRSWETPEWLVLVLLDRDDYSVRRATALRTKDVPAGRRSSRGDRGTAIVMLDDVFDAGRDLGSELEAAAGDGGALRRAARRSIDEIQSTPASRRRARRWRTGRPPAS